MILDGWRVQIGTVGPSVRIFGPVAGLDFQKDKKIGLDFKTVCSENFQNSDHGPDQQIRTS